MKLNPILTCLLGAVFTGMPAAHATLGITNGNFETGGGANINNVTDWFDKTTGGFWEGAWQSNAQTPNGTNVAVFSSFQADDFGAPTPNANDGGYLYQSIGTADGLTSLNIQFDWGAPTDDNIARDLGVTVGVYAYDGLGGFTAADNTDVRGASGVTFLGSMSFTSAANTRTAGGTIFTGNLATFDLTGAGSQQLFLRFNNYLPTTTECWPVVDNVTIVTDVPVFTTQPLDYNGEVGDVVTLTSAATSNPAAAFQWEYSANDTTYTVVTDGGNVAGATTATLTITDASFAQNGYYRVVADNGSSVTSDVAQVSLTYPDPVITGQPVGGAVQVGSNASFSVTATGLGTLSYQWHNYKTGMLVDGGSISGATTATLTLTNVQLADADDFYCEVTDHKATEDGLGEPDTTVYSTDATLVVFEANSGLLSFEPFIAYPTGVALTNQNPSVDGYVDAWLDEAFGDALPATSAGSLAYGGAGYTAGIGGKVGKGADAAGIGAANSGRSARMLATNLKGTALSSQTVYLSWLFQTGNENAAAGANNYQVLGLWNGNSGTDSLRVFEAGIALGDFGTGNYGFRVNNNNATRVNLGIAPDTNVHLFVARFELSANSNSDSVTVWIDPALGAGEPTGGALIAGVNLSFDRLTLSDYASDSSQWDEIRWGTTFDSVTVGQPAIPLVPEFTLQPTDHTGHVGDTVTLTAVAEGNPEPTYQWEFDDGSGFVALPGETGSSLLLSPAAFADNGNYRVIAHNDNGDTTSNEVLVSLIYPDPVISAQPASVAALAGADVELSVTATGLGNLSYQWYKVDAGGDIELTGETAATLQLNGISAGDAGSYYVIVSDDAAVADEGFPTETTSTTATVTVVDVQVTASDVAPTTDSFDQFYLPGNVDDVANIDGSPGGVPITASNANDASTYVAFDKTSQGMTFTTGSDPLGYTISSITVRNVQWNNYLGNGTFYNIQNGDTFEFQVGTVADGVKTPIFDTNTAQYSGANLVNAAAPNNLGSGNYLTFDLSAAGIGTLAPNTTYYFEIAAETGDAFFELSGTSADGYAGGTAFRGDTMAIIDGTYVELAGDRAFHVDLTGLSGPADDYAAWISGYPGVGGLTGFTDDADGDGIENGLENFFGSDPSVASTGITQVGKSNNTVTFQHPQNASVASDVVATYGWTTDLVTIHADGESNGSATVSFASSPDTPVAGITTVTATISGVVPPKLFVVLKANTNP